MTQQISKYDIVRILVPNPSVPDAEVGDQGAVVMVYFESAVPVAYEIECVLPDGNNKWLGTFSPNQIILQQKAQVGNTEQV
ncbi:hypothetical protein [Kangiella sp.]|uniref:hypothetical protein n=1 Tax=Kangiella sp. TaxID=1920245 RepID=UPI0025C4E389|nr:hypothetical protein [Kangiella sp.]